MNRQQKATVVENLKKGLLSSKAIYLVGFRGLNVAQMQSLRSGLRDKGGSLKVAKARLMRLAVDGEAGIDRLSPFFRDQVGIVFAQEQFSDVAKILSDFSKKNEALNFVVGYLESQVIDKGRMSQIALLPPREVLLAQVCGTLNAPIVGLVRSLNMIVLQLLFVLKQVGDKKK